MHITERRRAGMLCRNHRNIPVEYPSASGARGGALQGVRGVIEGIAEHPNGDTHEETKTAIDDAPRSVGCKVGELDLNNEP